jgi:hypothetical protein
MLSSDVDEDPVWKGYILAAIGNWNAVKDKTGWEFVPCERSIDGPQPLRCDGNAALPNLDVVILWRDLASFLGQHSCELIVADPIFVDDVGKDSAWRRYALRAEGPPADGSVEQLLEELLCMAREVLCPRRGTLLLKIGDGNHGDRPQRNAYLVNQLVDRFGLYVCSQWTLPSKSMLAADGVQTHQQRSFQQALRRNRGPAIVNVHLVEHGRQLRQRGISHVPDRPQRMIQRNARLDIDKRQHAHLRVLSAAHPHHLSLGWLHDSHSTSRPEDP